MTATPHGPEKSAAERARELDAFFADPKFMCGTPEIVELRALLPLLLQDLAAATDRAEKAEQDAAECRSLRDVANQSLERRTKEMLAAEERAERAEKELVKALTERDRYQAFLSQLQRITAGTMGTQEAIAALQADAERWRDLANQGQWNSDRLQAELTISRAAMDRTRQDADAKLSWIGLARPVIEKVHAYQVAYQNHMAHYEGSLDEHMKTFNESIAALHALREVPLPLPPKETPR